MTRAITRESSLDHGDVNTVNKNFITSIELIQKETTLLNGCDGDITKYYFINNICDLQDKSAENVAAFIKYRFFKKQIYTWAGQTLIALQPYDVNYKNKSGKDDDTSIHAVVNRVWFQLSNRIGKINQSIVISGNSGSGKTYSACVALKYLGSQPHICDQQILRDVLYKTWSSVPVLAAFGNASTMYNINSSRFGKLVQIQCRNGRIVGAFLQTFMLERSRVSGPNRGESNFHIFNQILGDTDEATLEKIFLSKTTEYKICPKLHYRNTSSFSDTVAAFKYLSISEIDEIMKIVSLILNFGNIDFANKDDKLTIPQESKQYVNFCAKILQCNTSCLTQLFVKRLIAPKLRRGSICYTSCINIEECQERRNSLMRFLYDQLFNWLVEKINKQMYYQENCDSFGILDIYGFESFSYNTFEQLCINYANERLQQYYVNDYYNKQVNYLYEKSEKIIVKYDMSKYHKRISLLDGTLSVFGILNEECLVKRYNTDIFIGSRLSSGLRKHEYYIDRNDSKSTKFCIRHYAGTVEYDCRSMVNKNRDKIPEEMISLLKEANFKFLTEIMTKTEDVQYTNCRTLLTKFKKSMDNLMVTLNKADVNYIKCLKPNQEQRPDYFDEHFFIDQLKYNGVIDTLNLDCQTLPTVISKVEFTKRFGMWLLDDLENVLKGKFYIGRDKMHFSEKAFRTILKYKTILMTSSVRKIQSYWRTRNVKRHNAASKIQQNFRKILHARKLSIVDSLDSTFDEPTVIENINFQPKIIEAISFQEDDIKDKHILRTIFKGDRIISRQRIAQVPVRCHLRKTCIPFSYVLPNEEAPSGLSDIF